MISYHASLTGRAQLDWHASLLVARQAGFAAIDVSLPEAAAESERDETAAGASLGGLRAGPASLPVEFRLDEQRFVRDLSSLPALAAAAARLGVATMYRSIPASSGTPAGELAAILQRRLSLCARVLAEHTISLAIEILGPLHRRREGPYEFIWTLTDGAEFASGCGPGVGLLLDSWHWHHADGSVQEIIDISGQLLHVHVADAPDIPPAVVRDDKRLLPGRGVVNFEAFFGVLATVGYSGMVSPEVRGYRCGGDSVSCAATAREAVERELDRYFRCEFDG
jgi:sugar phosphate isomerase/epimerase